MATHLDDVALAMLNEHQYVVLRDRWPYLDTACSCGRFETNNGLHHVTWRSWVEHMRIELNGN